MTQSPHPDAGEQLAVLEHVSNLFAESAAAVELHASVASELWPTAARMIDHVGTIYAWVAGIVSTGKKGTRGAFTPRSAAALTAWFAEQRRAVLQALATADPKAPCWTLYDRPGTACFWRRRMIHETTMHLTDLRTASGSAASPISAIAATVYADGIDEHFEVFLSHSRPGLEPLPRPLSLTGHDVARRWTLDSDWNLSDAVVPGATEVAGDAGSLALFAWDRVLPRIDRRLTVSGEADVLAAYRIAPVHP
jgi:uncharacterized protein (TIGR03083 family)